MKNFTPSLPHVEEIFSAKSHMKLRMKKKT